MDVQIQLSIQEIERLSLHTMAKTLLGARKREQAKNRKSAAAVQSLPSPRSQIKAAAEKAKQAAAAEKQRQEKKNDERSKADKAQRESNDKTLEEQRRAAEFELGDGRREHARRLGREAVRRGRVRFAKVDDEAPQHVPNWQARVAHQRVQLVAQLRRLARCEPLALLRRAAPRRGEQRVLRRRSAGGKDQCGNQSGKADKTGERRGNTLILLVGGRGAGRRGNPHVV